MNKKGQELPVTTIILIILVVVVLVVIVAFFLGGTSTLTGTIKRIFFGTTAGYDLTLATQTCTDRCEQAKNLPSDLRGKSAYCKSALNVDFKPVDGEADFYRDKRDQNKKKPIRYYCPPDTAYQTTLPPNTDEGYDLLGITCDLGEGVRCENPTPP